MSLATRQHHATNGLVAIVVIFSIEVDIKQMPPIGTGAFSIDDNAAKRSGHIIQ